MNNTYLPVLMFRQRHPPHGAALLWLCQNPVLLFPALPQLCLSHLQNDYQPHSHQYSVFHTWHDILLLLFRLHSFSLIASIISLCQPLCRSEPLLLPCDKSEQFIASYRNILYVPRPNSIPAFTSLTDLPERWGCLPCLVRLWLVGDMPSERPTNSLYFLVRSLSRKIVMT